ncbi:uncharacterized protein LOC144179611 [Haemaphysalis longicornis]
MEQAEKSRPAERDRREQRARQPGGEAAGPALSGLLNGERQPAERDLQEQRARHPGGEAARAALNGRLNGDRGNLCGLLSSGEAAWRAVSGGISSPLKEKRQARSRRAIVWWTPRRKERCING